MKTIKIILSAVIKDAEYYLNRNVPDMSMDPQIVLDLAKDAERCAELEQENSLLKARLQTECMVNDVRGNANEANLEAAIHMAEENGRLRANLEKVRLVEETLRNSAENYGSNDFVPWTAEALLALAGKLAWALANEASRPRRNQ